MRMEKSQDDIFSYTLRILLLASLVELLLNRTLSRVGIFIPKKGIMISIFSLLRSLGIFALDLSSVLVVLALLLVVGSMLRNPTTLNKALAFLISFLILLSIGFIFVAPSAGVSMLYNLASLLAVLLLAYRFKGNRMEKVVILLLVGVFLGPYYYKLSIAYHQLLGISTAPRFAVAALSLGELLALVASLLIFVEYSGFRVGKDTLMATLIAVPFLVANVVNNKLTAMVTIWSIGYALYLPYPLYAIALWLFSSAVARLLFEGRSAGYGLAFIFVAGYTFPLTYQQLLLILGFALLTPNRAEP